MAELKAKDGTVFIVDDDDYIELSKHKWRVGKDGYIVRTFYRSDPQGCVTYYLHRQILGLKIGDGRIGDHINGDILDNRRGNLRIVDWKQSGANKGRKKTIHSTSKYRGVRRHRRRFIVTVGDRGKLHHGSYATEEEAALAYNYYAKRAYGEYARLNVLPTKVA